MKLLFKQRFFSWLDSYDIYDADGNVIFEVKGQFSLGHCLHVYDAEGNRVGELQEKLLTFLPKFEIYIGGGYAGEIRKEFSLFTPRYTLDMNDWEVEGDWLGWDYEVTDGGRTVATVSKQLLNWTDTYVIDVAKEEDALTALMIVLAIDAANCDQ